MASGIKKLKSRKRSHRLSGRPSPDDYQIVVQWSEEDACYLATLPAWQNARTHGSTPEQAIRNAREVLGLLIQSATKHGHPFSAASLEIFACACQRRSTVDLPARPNARGSA
jgi:antitoxin HicB